MARTNKPVKAGSVLLPVPVAVTGKRKRAEHSNHEPQSLTSQAELASSTPTLQSQDPTLEQPLLDTNLDLNTPSPVTAEDANINLENVRLLPAEICDKIASHCRWETLKALSLVSPWWNTHARVYLSRTLTIPLDETGKVPNLSAAQKAQIEKHTTRLSVASGRSWMSQQQALAIISLLNPKNCLAFQFSSLAALHPKQHKHMVQLLDSMPKLLELGLPAVRYLIEAPPLHSHQSASMSRPEDRLYLNSTLKLKENKDNGRSIVCTMNSGDTTRSGTPKDVFFRMVSTQCASNVGPEDLILTELSLRPNLYQHVSDFRSFLDLLGFRGRRTDFLVRLEVIETSFWGSVAGATHHLRGLSVRSLKHLRIRDCAVIWPLLSHIASEGHHLGSLALTSMDIAGQWAGDDIIWGQSGYITRIWMYSHSMERFAYRSELNLDTGPLLSVIKARGATLRSFTYERSVMRLDVWEGLLPACPLLEELAIERLRLPGMTHSDWQNILDQMIDNTNTGDGYYPIKIATRHNPSELRIWLVHPQHIVRLSGDVVQDPKEKLLSALRLYCTWLELHTYPTFRTMKITLDATWTIAFDKHEQLVVMQQKYL